jgi:lysophospholipase L1-like esterase
MNSLLRAIFLIICFIARGSGFKALFEPRAPMPPAGPSEYQTVEDDAMPVPVVPPDDPVIVPMSRPEEWWQDRHGEKAGDIRRNQKIVFIGDSIVQRWEEEGLEAWQELDQRYGSKITNLGFGADRIQHVIWRLNNGEFPARINPEYIVLLVGTNNLLFFSDSPESMAAGIGNIIETLHKRSPKSKIVLCSLLPSDSSIGIGDIESKRGAVNSMIMEYDGYLNVSYVDIGQYYTDDAGNLRDGLFADGVHLTLEGYNIWKDKIIEIVG